MQSIKVLLLISEKASDLSSTLCNILDSPLCAHLDLRYDVVTYCYAESEGKDDLLRLIKEFAPNLCFIGLSPRLLERVGTLLQLIRAEAPRTSVITIVEEGELNQMVELLRQGVTDFISPPLKAVDIIPHVSRLAEGSTRCEATQISSKGVSDLKQLIGESPAFLAEISKIPSVAICDASVLISGETGTGKELCARAIHYLGPRASKPFIPINCGAIPTDLVENELFGHKRGAFTGAMTMEAGLIQEADGGTLFMDEIDCLPLLAQVKVLRFLQEKEYRPLGSTKTLKANVRVIAATNLNVQEAVLTGKVRTDLFYRLNVISLSLPPLRARCQDIPILARHFLTRYAAASNKPARDLSDDALELLLNYDWPGNVRELENAIERAILLCEKPLIQATDIILHRLRPALEEDPFHAAKKELVSNFEKSYIENLLMANRGNVSKAARIARKSRRTFWRLISKHHIDVQSYRVAAK